MSTPQWPSVPDQPASSGSALPVPAETIAEPARLSPVLPILFTVLWIIVCPIALFLGFFSVFMSDAGSSTPIEMVFFGFTGTVLLCPISIIATWIAWGTTRKDPSSGLKRVVRTIAYCLPFIGILSVLLGFITIATVCGGSFQCQ
jgi:hypothetical protein